VDRLDRGESHDDRHRPGGQVKHRVRHPVERRRMQRQRLALRDLLGPDPTLDRDRLRRERVGLGDPDQRFGQPQPHERDRLLARARRPTRH
jgi:hypothetical protein